MSVKLPTALITSAVLCCVAPTAHAKWWDDPLMTTPDVLKKGVVLPNDASSLNCAMPQRISGVLTLAQAADIALCHNTQVRSTWIAIKIQADSLGVARAAYLPTLTGTASRLHNKTRYPDQAEQPDPYWGTTHYLSLSWRLFDFGGRGAAQKSARWLLDAAIANQQAVLQQTLGGVVQGYFDLTTAKAELLGQQTLSALAQGTVDSTLRRESLGVSKAGDTVQAAIALSRTNIELQRAQAKYRQSLASLSYQLGIPADSVFEPVGLDAIVQPKTAMKDLSQWLAYAKQHPSIVAASAKVESARQGVVVAASDGLPTLDLVANRYQNGYPGQGVNSTRSNTTTYGVTLNVPFFRGFADYYKIRGAQDQVAQSQNDMTAAQQRVIAEVTIAYGQAVSALNNLQTSANMFSAAEGLVDISARRFNNGAGDVLELINSQNTYAQAQKDRIRCLSDWQTARWRLFSSVGQLGRDGLVK